MNNLLYEALIPFIKSSFEFGLAFIRIKNDQFYQIPLHLFI